MNSIDVREAVIEGMRGALSKLEAEQAAAKGESPLEKKAARLRESGTDTASVERQLREAKILKKARKKQFEEAASIGRRLGLSEKGAEAFARGRFRG